MGFILLTSINRIAKQAHVESNIIRELINCNSPLAQRIKYKKKAYNPSCRNQSMSYLTITTVPSTMWYLGNVTSSMISVNKINWWWELRWTVCWKATSGPWNYSFMMFLCVRWWSLIVLFPIYVFYQLYLRPPWF